MSQHQRAIREWGPAVLGLLVSLLFVHHPMIFSGFQRMQWDMGDTRLVNVLLEHAWGWVTRQPADASFWDPPLFWPEKGVGAYTETMLGVAPFYWPWRLVGMQPDAALQAWMLTMTALNFCSFYLLLRRPLHFSGWASAAGAVLFSVGAPRINAFGHAQLLPHFYTVAVVYALARVVAAGDTPEEKRAAARWLVVLAVAAALQLWACYYLGWFLGLCLGLGFLWALLFRDGRRAIARTVLRHWVAVPVAATVGVAIVAPMAKAYLAASETVGLRDWRMVLAMTPRGWSYLDMGPWSWLYGSVHESGVFDSLPLEWEHRIGFGVVAPVCLLVGAWLFRRRVGVVVLSAAVISTLALAMVYPFWDNWTPWNWVFLHVPGAGALRSVSRIGIMGLFPCSVALAQVVERLLGWKWGQLGALAICGLVFLEQGLTSPHFDRQRVRDDLKAIADQVRPECSAFLYTPVGGIGDINRYHIDAMQVEMYTGIPTLNGYSGNFPRGWPFASVFLNWAGDEERIRNGLKAWTAQHSVDPSKVCWVRLHPAFDPMYSSKFVSHDAPSTMKAGQKYGFSITFQNTGTETWRNHTRCELRELHGAEQKLGLGAVVLRETVYTGATVTFRMEVTAPAEAGPVELQWRMFKREVGWLGEPTPPMVIQVER